MVLTERDKRLFMLLIVIVSIALVYLLGFKPLNKQKEQLEQEVKSLEAEYSVLKEKLGKKEFMETELKKTNFELEKMNEQLPSSLTQDYIILLVKEIEDKTGISLNNISFTEFKEVKSTEQEENQLTAIKMDVNVTLEGTYNQLKEFLKYIVNNELKISVSNLAITNNIIENNLQGSVLLSFYAILNKEQGVDQITTYDFEKGKQNITEPFNEYKDFLKDITTLNYRENHETKAEQIDFFAVLKPYSSDMPTVTIGREGDKYAKSYVYADNEKEEDIELVVMQEDDNYYFKYRTKRESYPDSYNNGQVEFYPSDNIVFKIYSTERNSANDFSGIDLKIINSTDKQLKIIIQGDDPIRPRVNITELKGEVLVQ